MLIPATILGQSPSSTGMTLALLITFVGIGVVVGALIFYILLQVTVEHRQNVERRRRHETT
jgi:hypothetical protein